MQSWNFYVPGTFGNLSTVSRAITILMIQVVLIRNARLSSCSGNLMSRQTVWLFFSFQSKNAHEKTGEDYLYAKYE